MSRDYDSFGLLLKEIGRYSIPTPEQELIWGRQIQEWVKFRDSEKLKSTIAPGEYAHLERLGQRAKREMIQRNLRLVVSICKKYANRGLGLDLQDLFQEGAIGLNRAAEKFDPSTGYKFSTYAYWWIRQGITRALATQGRLIRLPVHVVEKINRIKAVARDFCRDHGRMPTTKELAAAKDENGELLLDPPTIALIGSNITLDALSLDRPSFKTENRFEVADTLLGTIADQSESPWEAIEDAEVREAIASLLSDLPERERFIIEQRHGIGCEPKTLAEIRLEIGLSRERVRQVQAKASRKLRGKVVRQSHRFADLLG